MDQQKEITLLRNCKAIVIPDGNTIELEKGCPVIITQSLGAFTLQTYNGYLVRIDYKDADALGKEIPKELTELDEKSKKEENIEEVIWEHLKTCYDPEIPVNIVELGLIYSCKVHKITKGKYDVNIAMTLTAPGCGMGEVLKQDVEDKISSIPFVDNVLVDLVFDPPWDMSMMSEAARLKTGLM